MSRSQTKLSYLDIARLQTKDDKEFCSRKPNRIKVEVVEKKFVCNGDVKSLFESNPFGLILGPLKCQCNKSGCGCDRSDCGFTRK